MSQPWEPPGQQPPPPEPPAADEPQPTRALPPAHPVHPADASGQGGAGHPGHPPPLPGYAAYPGSQGGPYTAPPYAGGPPPPAYPGYQPYGYQPYAPYAAGPPGPPASGATTITAAVIQLVQSTFWVAVGIVLVVAARDTESFFDTTGLGPEARADARGALIGAGVLIILVAGAMIALAVLALRRVNGCRIASAVVQIVFGVLSLISLLRGVSDGDGAATAAGLLATGACAAAAILFLLSSSARYCQRAVPRPPGY